MVKVVLDTNMLISIFELKLDILSLIDSEFGPNKYCTINSVIDELRHHKAALAVPALQLSKKIPVVDYTSKESVDDQLITFCQENDFYLATMDKELQEKAKSKHLKIIGIRQKKYLKIL